MSTDRDDTEFSNSHASPTDHVLTELQRYGYRPFQDEPDPRPLLLRLGGWPKVEKVLQAIDAVEALGIDPANAAPDHWRHVHNRLSVGERPRPYSRARHEAWLRRRKLAP